MIAMGRRERLRTRGTGRVSARHRRTRHARGQSVSIIFLQSFIAALLNSHGDVHSLSLSSPPHCTAARCRGREDTIYGELSVTS